MNETPATPPASPTPHCRIWWLGILLGDLAVGLIFGIGFVLVNAEVFPALLTPSFFLAPVVAGLVASYFWCGLVPRVGQVVLNCLWMTLIALVGAGVVFHEGFICLLIVAPIFYVMALAGALVGRILFRKKPTRLFVSLLPSLALIALAEPMTRNDQERIITDELVIRASPARVWREVTAFPPIPEAPGFWLFRLGLPYPVATTTAGDFISADRACIFSQEAIFKEKVSELVTEEKLTFDIVELPNDPELIGHLTPRRGQFVLLRNPDGTTSLKGSTWYTLHVRPGWYFDWWTRHIFRAVHLRVMDDVKRRAEAP